MKKQAQTGIEKRRTGAGPLKKLMAVRGLGQVITVAVGLVALCIVFFILNDRFFSKANVDNLLRQIAPILLIGIGQSYVLITANIDLSIGSLLGMSCMVSATMMQNGTPALMAVLITILVCVMVGVINGVLVATCKLPAFIGTLGTMTIARGIAQVVNNNYNTDAISSGIGNVAAREFQDFFYYGKTLGLFNTIWIVLALWLIFNFILSMTRSGRHIYAIGSNLEAAQLSGVNVAATTTKAYMVSAFCSCIAGLIACATTGMGTMDAGTGYELYAVAASVIGGVSTMGGQGILLGTVIGASIWGVLQNGLQFAGAPVAIRNIVIGIIVIVSVLLDVLVRTGKRKKKPRS